MKRYMLLILLTSVLLFTSCANSGNDISSNTDAQSKGEDTSQNISTENSQNSESNQALGKVISAKEAKERLDADKSIIIVDVRTKEEYLEKHIPNALLLPVDTISEKAATVIPEKTKTYFIYCRSGNRSATAAAMLVQMGYTSIYDFGGIIDWPYETVSGE